VQRQRQEQQQQQQEQATASTNTAQQVAKGMDKQNDGALGSVV
jgi:hypothetical protein